MATPSAGRTTQGDYIRHWLCKVCYADMLRVPTARVTMKTKFMMPCNPTTRPALHMGKHGYDEAGNKLNSAKKRKQDTIRDCINKQQRLHDTVFDRKGWQTSYTTWIACSGVSLRQASQPELYNLPTFHNPKIEQLVPRNDHTTPRRWIMDSYHAARSRVELTPEDKKLEDHQKSRFCHGQGQLLYHSKAQLKLSTHTL